MNRCKVLMTLVLMTLTMLGCQQEQSADTPVVVPPEKIVQVTVHTVEPRAITETFTLPGHLEAWEDLILSAELAGPVRWVGPQEGDPLTAGQKILKIDTDTLSADYDRDSSDWQVKAQKLERMERLAEKNLISEQELDDMASAVAAAQATLQQTELRLTKSTLKTPIAAVLDSLMVDRGEFVSVGQPLVRLLQVDRLKVFVDVPEKDVDYLHVGDPIELSTATIDQQQAINRSGVLLAVSYAADPVTRTYRAKIGIDNIGHRLRPGRIVRVYFKRRQIDKALTVPLYALVERDGSKALFIEQQGTVRQRTIETGAVIGDQVVITSGLEAGDRVVVKGQQLISDNAKVMVEGI